MIWQITFLTTGLYAPTSTETTRLVETNWTYAIAHYTLNSQTERIEVFATVYQGKAYIIELQAAESQFDTIYTQLLSQDDKAVSSSSRVQPDAEELVKYLLYHPGLHQWHDQSRTGNVCLAAAGSIFRDIALISGPTSSD